MRVAIPARRPRSLVRWRRLVVFFGSWAAAPALGTAQVDSSSVALPGTIPIFPLQAVTLFPNTTAPFHIFEPRYRAMIADALAGDSIIGMAVLQPGYEAEYEGRPPIYATGCAGVIVSAERLPDGRYNIVLRGLTRFRVVGEDRTRAYRLAQIDVLSDTVAEGDRALLAERRRQLEQAATSRFPNVPPPRAELTDEEVVDGLALLLPLRPAERLELLEAAGPLERAELLLGLLRGGSRI
jgi:Lon protease-like protein